MYLILDRYNYGPNCTEGELYLRDGANMEWVCWTLERPWADNRPSVSCIPDGVYRVFAHTRPSGEECFMVLDEPCCASADQLDDKHTRWGILFHAGNTVDDSQGCILPGLDRKPERVTNSVRALSRMRRLLYSHLKAHQSVYMVVRPVLGAILL